MYIYIKHMWGGGEVTGVCRFLIPCSLNSCVDSEGTQACIPGGRMAWETLVLSTAEAK